MSDSFVQLAQQDIGTALSLSVLPSLSRNENPLLVRCEQGKISTKSGETHANNGGGTHRLIGFSSQLSAAKIYTILSCVCAEDGITVSLSCFEPLDSMSPAIVISGINNPEQLKPMIAEMASALEVELVLVDNPPTTQQPGLLLMDMDSTAIQIECIDEIAALAGVGNEVAAVTKRAMQGELDFAQSLVSRVATLKNADEGILAQVADTLPLMPGLERLVAHLKSKGWVVAIASGGFTYFTDRLKLKLGLTATFANQLEIIEGKLTGQVLGDIVDAQVKADVVEQLAAQYGIKASQTVAIGDGANDLIMLGKAALGVAFHAKPVVRQQAQAAVNHGGLDQLLYLLLPAND